MRLRHRRIFKILRRVTVISTLFLLYVARVSFVLQVRNTFSETAGVEYRGGLIDDVRTIRCYRWFRQCGSLFARSATNDRIVSWSRISKNLTDEALYSIESRLLYRTFLYVHQLEPTSEKGPITELAISRHASLIPIQVTQDVQKLIKGSDSSVFHNHIHRQKKNLLNFLGGEESDLDIIYSLGEDWEYKGRGIWCKHQADQDPVSNVEIYLGPGFHESRPHWKEVIHEFGRSDGDRDVPLSVTREVDGLVEGHRDETEATGDSLDLDHNGPFKILQISDVHFRCTDETTAVLNEFQTKRFVAEVISRESPDLVVITGDILDGQKSLDYQACIMKLVQPMIKLGIPYVIAFGTSDHSSFATTLQIQDFLTNLPYCMNKKSSSDGHIALTVHFKSGSDAVFYVFDSFKPIKPFLLEHEYYKSYKYALAFRHLPIPEYRPEGLFPIIGQYNEQSSYKSKLKEEKIIQKLLQSFNIKAMSCGHEHSNDCCLQSHGEMWLCYAGSSGVGIDRLNDMEPSVRLFMIDDELGEITSWKRNFRTINSVYDYQYIFQEK